MSEEKDLAYYMGLPYSYHLIPDREDGGFLVKVPELPGCMSQGTTADEATTRIREAMEAWIGARLEGGRPVPEPEENLALNAADGYSGRFVVRVPKNVHAAIAKAAEREDVSLNLFVATTLARAVGAVESLPGRRARKSQASGGDRQVVG